MFEELPYKLDRLYLGANIHVYPVDDLMPHNTENFNCWCRPTITEEYDTFIVIHKSADGREDYEDRLL